MLTTIHVMPNKPSAIGIKHPDGPKLTADGALWPRDSFTARRLRDGSVVEPVKAEAAAETITAPKA